METDTSLDSPLPGALIPQADDLDTVRAVVDSVARGAGTTKEIADDTGFSLRHSEYRLRAAELLSLVERKDDRLRATKQGRALLDTGAQGERERRLLLDLIGKSPLAQLVPELFDRQIPNRDSIAERLTRATGMAMSTAQRRAGTLLTWRRRLASRQLTLFDEAYL